MSSGTRPMNGHWISGAGSWPVRTLVRWQSSTRMIPAPRMRAVVCPSCPGAVLCAFEDVAFSQELREISEPVKTQYGYHLIQALEIKEAGVKPLDEVTEEIRTQLLQPRQKQVWEEWIQTAREDLEVVVREGLELVTTTTTSVAPDGTGSTDPSASDSAGTSDK